MNERLYSDLELLVMADMIDEGFNPTTPQAIKTYWEIMLDGN